MAGHRIYNGQEVYRIFYRLQYDNCHYPQQRYIQLNENFLRNHKNNLVLMGKGLLDYFRIQHVYVTFQGNDQLHEPMLKLVLQMLHHLLHHTHTQLYSFLMVYSPLPQRFLQH